MCQALSQAVYIDLDMWEKIVFNLVANAFKYTTRGYIAISVADVDGWAQLTGEFSFVFLSLLES